MMARSHVVVGVASWAGLQWAINGNDGADLLALGLAGAGALLPDLDHPGSTFGRLVPFISIPIAALFGHRGITHSLVGVVLVLIGTCWAGGGWCAWPLGVGYISHVAADMVTPSGCPLLWPSRRAFSFNLWRSGAPVETVFSIGLLAWLVWAEGWDMVASGLNLVAWVSSI